MSTADLNYLIDRLESLQAQLTAIAARFSNHGCRCQFHPDISPVGWHLGHTVFVEDFWIREAILGKPVQRVEQQLYAPKNSPRDCRARKLPDKEKLLSDSVARQHENLELLRRLPRRLKNHVLMKNNYLTMFLVQHHALHLETMYMILTEYNLQNDYSDYRPTQLLNARQVVTACHCFAGSSYRIGSQDPESFDNEKPVHWRTLADFAVCKSPVSNAEYLEFIRTDGYSNRHYWSDAGWQWRLRTRTKAPHHWRTNYADNWFGIDDKGAYTLLPGASVYGLSHYEAEAFARWARARLPHEHELEIAQRSAAIRKTSVWEWCCNTFYPYSGFRAFPYDDYSTPWFDRRHFVLKGGSRYTDTTLIRPSIRNFYSPGKRHIFAGLRLAFDKQQTNSL